MNIKNIFSNFISNLEVIKKDKFNMDTLETMYGTKTILNPTITKGTNYSAASGNAYLLGSTLKIYFTATRSSSLAAGNVTNEVICTIKINSDKIDNIWNVSFFNGWTGPIASLYTGDITKDENGIWNIKIYLSASGQALSAVETTFLMPVELNLDAY